MHGKQKMKIMMMRNKKMKMMMKKKKLLLLLLLLLLLFLIVKMMMMMLKMNLEQVDVEQPQSLDGKAMVRERVEPTACSESSDWAM